MIPRYPHFTQQQRLGHELIGEGRRVRHAPQPSQVAPHLHGLGGLEALDLRSGERRVDIPVQEAAIEAARTRGETDAPLTGGLLDVLSPLQQIVVGHAHRIAACGEILERILAGGEEIGGLHPRDEGLDAFHFRDFEQV